MLFDKLRQIEERSNEIARALSDPAIFSQPNEYARLRKEHAETVEIVERFILYRDILRRIGEARHILAEGGDRELAELAQAEIDDLTAKQTALEEELKRLLLPRDPNDDKNVFVEIRAGAGGDEAALFAADRKSQVGTGERSERIRTYNFPQTRVTDHRIGLTLHRLPTVLEGDLDEVIDALAAAEQAELLER